MNWKQSLAEVILLLCFYDRSKCTDTRVEPYGYGRFPRGEVLNIFVGGTFMAESSALYGGTFWAYGVR